VFPRAQVALDRRAATETCHQRKWSLTILRRVTLHSDSVHSYMSNYAYPYFMGVLGLSRSYMSSVFVGGDHR